MRIVLVVILLLVMVGQAQAQTSTPTPSDTPTPTATFTPTATPTQTPELSIMWTVPAPSEESPGQDVVMEYVFTLDEVITAVLLFTILVILLSGFALALLKGWM